MNVLQWFAAVLLRSALIWCSFAAFCNDLVVLLRSAMIWGSFPAFCNDLGQFCCVLQLFWHSFAAFCSDLGSFCWIHGPRPCSVQGDALEPFAHPGQILEAKLLRSALTDARPSRPHIYMQALDLRRRCIIHPGLRFRFALQSPDLRFRFVLQTSDPPTTARRVWCEKLLYCCLCCTAVYAAVAAMLNIWYAF